MSAAHLVPSTPHQLLSPSRFKSRWQLGVVFQSDPLAAGPAGTPTSAREVVWDSLIWDLFDILGQLHL